jgi:hypothetical protein
MVTIAKRLSEARAKAFKNTGTPLLISKAERMESCGNFVSVTTSGNVIANRCHRRGCPLCDTHKSRVAASIVGRALRRNNESNLRAYFFTTSTGSNCTAEELRSHVQLISEAFRKFMNYADIKKHSNIIGASRGTEVTYDRIHGYNPHTHIILWTYGELRIKDEERIAAISKRMQQLWTRAIKKGINQQPVTKLQPIQVERKEDTTLTDAYVRMIQYITKAFKMSADGVECDELDLPDHAQVAVATALRGLRLVSHSGWIKDEIRVQKEIDKKNRREQEEIKLHDPKRLELEDLTHFIWDRPRQAYIFRDDNVCFYTRPNPNDTRCTYSSDPDKTSVDPFKTPPPPTLEQERLQLFICKNKEVSDHGSTEEVL